MKSLHHPRKTDLDPIIMAQSIMQEEGVSSDDAIEKKGQDNTTLRESSVSISSVQEVDDDCNSSQETSVKVVPDSDPLNIRREIHRSHSVVFFVDGLQLDLKEEKQRGLRKDSSYSAEVTRIYKQRFLMLFLFSMCSMVNAAIWIQYAIIANVMSCYYGVSLYEMNWTVILYHVTFIPLVFPVAWITDRIGLRKTLLIGAFTNCLSACIQCATLAADRFAIVIVSQTIASIAQVFIVNLPPYVAAVWFGSEEVSRACAIGVLGNQLGIAVGSVIPPLLVSNDCGDKTEIAYGLRIIAYGLAGFNTLLFIVIALVFKERPPRRPSLAQANKPEEKPRYLRSLLNIIKNKNFNLLLISFGIIYGTYFSIASILNQMVLQHFPNEEVSVGWMGAILVFAGMAGTVVCSYVLDKTHKFRETCITMYVLSLLSMVAYTGIAILPQMYWQFIILTFIGFFLTGYVPIGFEFGAEITYPESEATAAGLLNCSTMIFSIVLTVVGSYLLQTHGDLASNLFFCALLLLGTITTVFIKCNFRRRKQYEDSDAKKEVQN